MQNMYELVKQHMNKPVVLQTTNGEQIQGIITNLDDENVYLSVPERTDEFQDESRQYPGYEPGPIYPPRPRPRPPYGPGPRPRPPYGPYPPYYPPYGPGPYYPGYPASYPPYGPGGSFNNLVIPLTALAALAVLPLL